MNRTRRDCPFPPIPTKKELEEFDLMRRGGPTPINFRADVSGKNMRSGWNRECAKIFRVEYIKQPDAVTKNKRIVEEAFLAHIPALCRQYAKLNGLKDEDPDADTDNVRRMRQKQVSTIYVNVVFTSTDTL